MVNVGIAGIGFMGVTHFKAWHVIEEASVTAICTRNEKKLNGDWSDIQGNFGGSGGKQDLTGITGYRAYTDLLADESIQLVDICLPTPMHKQTVLEAFEAGKDVVVEKPIALTLADADAMIDAAKANGRQLFVAQVLRFWPQWLALKRMLDDGRYGKLMGLSLQRVIAAPHWSASISDMGANGGPLIDLHIHDTDFVLYLLGKPQAVHATGMVQNDFVRYVTTNYVYPDGPVVNCRSGAVTTKGRPFQHGFEAYFEEATIAYTAATEPESIDPAHNESSQQKLTVYLPDGTAEHPTIGNEDGFVGQLRHAAECAAAGNASDVIGPQSARDALAVVLAEGESARSGQIVTLD